MQLKSLTLKNFKGVKDLTINPEGKNISIYGDNATGKTTIADAECWLLFNKDSKGTPNFSPKTKDEKGNDIHNLEHSVKGTYILSDGSIITFEKTLKEDWKTKRGSNTKTLSGHTTDYAIDGVPCKEKEYTERLRSIASDTDMMMLSLPMYFAESMSMKDRRSKLLDIAGDVTEYQVIASDESLSELSDYLRKPGTTSQYYSVSEYEKIAKASLKEINNKIKEIPGRIDEATKAIPVIDFSEKELDEQFAKLQCDKKILEIKLNATNNEQIAELNTKIAECKTELANAEAEHIKSNKDIYKDIDKEISDLNNNYWNTKNQLSKLNSEKDNLESKISKLKTLREETLAKYAEIEKSEWTGDTVCPTCNQPLPTEQIETAKEKFNLDKSNKLIELNEYGKKNCSKEMIAECEEKLSSLQAEITETESKLESMEDEWTALKEKRVSIKIPEFKATQEYKDITSRIEEYTAELVKVQKGLNSDMNTVKEKLAEINSQLDEINSKKSKIELAKTQEARIAELEKQEKDLGVQAEKVQKGIYLCEQFVRAKVKMLDDRINSLFKTVKFKLFDTQINGGVKEDCQVLVPSKEGLVPFPFANNAARINAGLEIISALSKYLNLEMPVFVDNAESVTRLLDSDLQIIRLVVSEADKKLRVE